MTPQELGEIWRRWLDHPRDRARVVDLQEALNRFCDERGLDSLSFSRAVEARRRADGPIVFDIKALDPTTEFEKVEGMDVGLAIEETLRGDPLPEPERIYLPPYEPPE